jgi:hypothetical protein
MRTTVNIDEEVLAAAKAKARMSGASIGETISQWALQGMKANAAKNPKRGSRLPSFAIKQNAPIIPADRAAELLDDEA